MKVVKVLQEQFNRIFEGLQYIKNDDGSISATIDHDKTDAANQYADTRFFGTKEDVLNGDETKSKHALSFDEYMKATLSALKAYKSLYDYAMNGMKGEIYIDDYTSAKTKQAIFKAVKNITDPKELANKAKTAYDRIYLPYQMRLQKYNRFNEFVPSKRNKGLVPKYNVGTIPDTNVKVITLFEFQDFNFSDVIKHGKLRQNKTTDKLLNIDPDQRPKEFKIGKGNTPLKKIPITYDNNKTPNIYNNFSLKGDYPEVSFNKNDFGRKSFPLNGGNDRTSIGGFIDKSILAASYALKKENFNPSYILDAPSSSKFNKLYSYRLSLKLGVPFEEGFFKRNVIECRIDDKSMLNDGIDEMTIEKIKREIVTNEEAEMASILVDKVLKFVKNNRHLILGNSQNFTIDNKEITDEYASKIIGNYLYEFIYNNISQNEGNVAKIIANDFAYKSNNITKGKITSEIRNRIISIFNYRKMRPIVNEFLSDFMNAYHSIVRKIINGYQPNFFANKFKITDYGQRFRKYLRNVYIIANQELNNDNQLFSRYKNSNFLIFDDDMNSGGTFQLLIAALHDHGIFDNQICCLANGYSPKGL